MIDELKKVERRLYDMPCGCCSGVYIPKNVMKKIFTLNAKYAGLVREILEDNKNDLYPAHWTLANVMDGEKIKKQTTIKYMLENEHWKGELDQRINLFSYERPKLVDALYIAKSHDHAREIAEAVMQEEIEQETATEE